TIAYLESIKFQYVRAKLRKKLQAQSHCSHWRLSKPYREQLLSIAEADELWLAKNRAMTVSLIKPGNMTEAAPGELQQEVAKLLAKTLTQTICARWSPYRFNMFTFAALVFILEKLRKIGQR
ncbi:MAG: hypothetical protein ACREDV_05580, partial [Methylocella sp.]